MNEKSPKLVVATPTERWIEDVCAGLGDPVSVGVGELSTHPEDYLAQPSVLVLSSSAELNVQDLRRRLSDSEVNPLLFIPISLSHLPGDGREDAAKAVLRYALKWSEEVSRLAHRAKRVLRTPPRRISRRDLLRMARSIWTYSEAPRLVGPCSGRLAASCRLCEQACPFSAVSVGETGPAISEFSCRDCGLCSAVCPVGALQTPTFTDWQVAHLDLLSPPGRALPWIALFTCDVGVAELARTKVPSAHVLPIRVPCAAAAGWVAILRAAESGVDGVAVYCPRRDCERRDAFVRSVEMVAKLSPLLGQRGAALQILEGEVQVIAEAAERVRVRSSEVSPTNVTIQRRRDVVAMAANLCSRPVTVEGLLYELEVDQRCTLCGVCAEKCPIGALHLEEREELGSLTFRQDLCVGCGYCIQVCPESAMKLYPAELNPQRDPFEARTLRSDEMVRCVECGAPIGPKSLVMAVYTRLKEQGLEKAAETALLCQECRAKKMLNGLA